MSPEKAGASAAPPAPAAAPATALRPSPRVAARAAYRVPRHPAPIDLRLDANEGPAPPPSLARALADAGPDRLRAYPALASLEARLAAAHGVTPGQVIVTAGADEAIDRACRAMLGPGREIVVPVPTFEMIAHYAALADGDVVEVPWDKGPYPLDAVLDRASERTALVAVVSPNNPTGAVARPDDVRALCEALPHALVLVDLAYAEFGDGALQRAALACPNALVVRTLSKAWGLAGLRVGYALGSPEVIGWLRAAGGPYSVAAPSAYVAERWLDEGREAAQAFVGRVCEERATLSSSLADLGAEVYPSEANFVFARFADAPWVRDALAGLGVGVRAYPGHPRLASGLRITLPGEPAAFARLSAALAAALRPEALLFDLDGVIADVSRSYRRAVVETARSFGVDATPEAVAAIKRAGDANNDWVVTHRLVAAAGGRATFDEIKARFEALYQGAPGRPGLRETEGLLADRALLERLAARRPLGVVTGRPRRDALAFLERFGLAGLFRATVTMEDAPAKPSPAPVRLCLERLGVERAWLVGDTPDDVRAARAAGVVPLGVVAPGDERPATEAALFAAGAARVLDSLEDLARLP